MSKDIEEIVEKHEKDIEQLKTAAEDKDSGSDRERIFSKVSSWAVVGIVALMLSHLAQNVKTFLTTIGK